MSRRRLLRIRRPRGPAELAAAGLTFAAVTALLLPGLRVLLGALVTHWQWPSLILPVVVGAGALRAGLTRSRQRRDRVRRAGTSFRAEQLDAMDDRAFEEALRDLMIRDGWRALRVGGGGDQAADVIAEQPLLGRAVLQAKHTRTGAKVGAPVLYAVKGTAGPVHGAQHAVVVTSGGFTRDARAWGARPHIHLVDRERLHQWAQDGAALHELLALPTRPRRILRRAA
ncbi:restriction endonuclease [Streptomyces sp. NPDC058301]|uniref:restriction endonuclease n=1 Tax=Streptomyces sp. NPDC058301 TaxID=3346436 RepID=UPI0036E5290C